MKGSAKNLTSSKQGSQAPDYIFDEQMIKSKQKMLKTFLQISIKSQTVT